jgi:hypothetical protein
LPRAHRFSFALRMTPVLCGFANSLRLGCGFGKVLRDLADEVIVKEEQDHALATWSPP